MTDRPPLSKGELAIARVLWELKKGTVREVHEALPKTAKMEFATVQTYLRRLEKKGYLHAGLAGRTRVYTAKVKPQTVIRETINDVVNRLFAGDTMPLMEHLIEDRGLSDDDIARLRQMLDRMDDTDKPS